MRIYAGGKHILQDQAHIWTKRILPGILFLAFFGVILSSSQKSSGDDKRVILAACEFPPYYGQELLQQGVVAEITAEAFKRVGYDVKIKFYPWARALDYGKKGVVDGILGLWHTPEREKWFGFSIPIQPNHLGFYKRKCDQITFTSYKDLTPFRIGIVLGYANPPDFEKVTLKTEAVITDKINLMKLYRNRIDLALIDKDLAQYLIKTDFPEYAETLEWMGPILRISWLYNGFSKQNKNYEMLLLDFNLGMIRLLEEGSVSRIRQKHGFINRTW